MLKVIIQTGVFLTQEDNMGSFIAHLGMASSCIMNEFIGSKNNPCSPALEHRAALMIEPLKITIPNPKCISLA